ncbi:MAG: ATP phosphoribosyltransferase [Nitrososphaerota archaeon]
MAVSRVKFAIPKGSLEAATLDILSRAMLKLHGADRTYRPVVDDPLLEVKILRPQEIPVLVESGAYDIGITGLDWVKETGADVLELMDLEYGRVQLVVAEPNTKNHQSLAEIIMDHPSLKISTEYLNTTLKHVMANPVYRRLYGSLQPMVVTPWWTRGENEKVKIFLSFGATEAKPPEDADIIVDASQTGITLEKNNLRVVEVIGESTARLIANRESYKDAEKREKILDIVTLLRGVVESGKKLHVFANVREENLSQLLTLLPSLKSPTISPLSVKGWYAINTVIPKGELLKILPTLRRLAQGLVIHEPQLILPLEDIVKESEKNNP